MTSELMFKLTIVLVVVSVASHVTLNVMLRTMDETELLLMTINKQRILKHPFVLVVGASNVLTKIAAAVSAVITAVLWLMGA